MGLVWTEMGGYVARRGHDATGRFCAQVQGHSGRYGVYFAPWAVGDDGGQWLGGFETIDEAMTAADRHVIAHLDSGGSAG